VHAKRTEDNTAAIYIPGTSKLDVILFDTGVWQVNNLQQFHFLKMRDLLNRYSILSLSEYRSEKKNLFGMKKMNNPSRSALKLRTKIEAIAVVARRPHNHPR
jgi:hypothetical protein